MNIFAIVLGLIVFVNTIISIMLFIAFIIFLTLWAYTDAKVRTLHPAFWTIVIVLGCFPLGLMVYLCVRRTANEGELPANSYKKAVIITFILIIVSVTINMIGTQLINTLNSREYAVRNLGQFYNLQHSIDEQEWVISANEANGSVDKIVYLSQDDLDNLTVSIQLIEGTVALGLWHPESDAFERLIISSEPITMIDTSQLEPGRIRKMVYFSDVTDVNLVINWSE